MRNAHKLYSEHLKVKTALETFVWSVGNIKMNFK